MVSRIRLNRSEINADIPIRINLVLDIPNPVQLHSDLQHLKHQYPKTSVRQ